MTVEETRGRPSKFNDVYIDQAYIICANLGLTMDELAPIFQCHVTTLYNWQAEQPKFRDALVRGREEFDTSQVKNAMRERALGYSHPDVHITNYKGLITKTVITKHYAPDTQAGVFWLTNRDPERWKNKQDVKTDITSNGKTICQPIEADQALKMIKALQK